MGAIFISHSSHDNALAEAMGEWLRCQGLDALFLDFDPADGITAGRDWEGELYRQLRRAHAVIVLCSPDSMASKWCFAEIAQARALGKHLFPIKIAPCELPAILKGAQVTDMTDPAKQEAAYARLHDGLHRAGLERSFRWDDTRPPYPGLPSFEEADAAVYFGRDDEIQQSLALLAQMRQFARRGLVLVLGASGSGKSSLVRAGIVPRLRQQSVSWLVVDPVRRRLDPFAELARALSRAYTETGASCDPGEIAERLVTAADRDPPDGMALHQMADEITQRSGHRDATPLLVLDQFEEYLVSEDAERRCQRLLGLIRAALESDAGPLVVLVTLRSDYLGGLQTHPVLGEVPFREVMVGPLSEHDYRAVIEGPAEVAGIPIEPGLADVLVAHTATADALPLLAFTLRELWERFGEPRQLTLQAYEDIGGLEGSVRRAAEGVTAGLVLSAAEEEALRRGLLAMTRVSDEGTYVRHPVRWEDLPPGNLTLLHPFVEARLLVSGNEAGTVEVAHEALFRAWPRLRDWLDAGRRFLLWRQTIDERARAWVATSPDDASQRDAGMLLRGGELATAEGFLSDYGVDLDTKTRAYIRSAVEQHEREMAAREQQRRRILQGLASFSAVAILLLGLAGWQWQVASIERDRAEAAQATAEWQADVSHAQALAAQAPNQLGLGEDERAALLAAEAYRLDEATGGQVRNQVDAALRTVLSHENFSTILKQGSTIWSIAYHPDGTAMATSSEDGTVRLWDLAVPAAEPIVLQGHEAWVATVSFNPDGTTLATGSVDGTARLWDLTDPEATPVILQGHEAWVTAVAFSPDGTTLATAGWDGTVRLWDLTDPAARPVILEHGNAVDAVAFSPDGTTLATGGHDHTVHLWNLTDHEASPILLHGHKDAIWAIAYHPDDPYLASGSWDGTVRIWDLTDLEAPPVVLEHGNPVDAVAFSPDGKNMATGSGGGFARLWDLTDLEAPPIVLEHGDAVFAVAYHPEGTSLATGSDDGSARLWDLTDPEATLIVFGHEDWVAAVAFSPKGSTLATVGHDGTARLWNLTNTEAPPIVLDHEAWVDAVAFNSDGTALATGSDDDAARLWDLTDPEAPPIVLEHEAGVDAVAFSPDGTTLATGSEDGTARLWNLTDPEASPIVLEHEAAVTAVAFSPEGTTLAIGSDDGTVRLWNLTDQETTPVLLGAHENRVWAITYHPDEATLATAGWDGTVRLWDLTDPEAPPIVLEHEAGVDTVAFSPDGSTLASGSDDDTVRLWDLTDLQAAPVVLEHEARITAVAFSPDGTTLATGSEDSSIRLHLLTDTLMEHICRQTRRNLTMEEWQRFIGPDVPYRRTCDQLPPGEGAPGAATPPATPLASRRPEVRQGRSLS